MSTIEKLKKQIAGLSEQDCNELMWFLMPLNGYEWVPGDDPEWEAELNRRWEEVESGKDPGKPVEQVLAEIDERYGWNRHASNGSQKKNSRKRSLTSRKKKPA